MIENALLAAASQHSAVGDYPAVRECFDKLAGLELPSAPGSGSRPSPSATVGSPHRRSSCPACRTTSSSSTPTPTSVRRPTRVGDGRRPLRRRHVDRRRPALPQRHPPPRARRPAHPRRRPRRAAPRPNPETSSTSPSCSASCSRMPRCRRSRSCSPAARRRSGAPPSRAALPLLQALVRHRAQGARRSRRPGPRGRAGRDRRPALPARVQPASRGSTARPATRVSAPRRCSRSQDPDRRGRRFPRHGPPPGRPAVCARPPTPR